jgi:hypothetical protein
MKQFHLGQRAEDLAVGAPKGSITSADCWVRSAPITIPGCPSSCVILGRVDALVACDDGTIGVIDFKTTEPKQPHVPTYGRQLHAYALALEHPASGPPTEVGSLGLLCFSPCEFEARGPKGALLGDLEWIDIPRNDEAFQAFLIQVISVLKQAEPPPASSRLCLVQLGSPGTCRVIRAFDRLWSGQKGGFGASI